MHFVPLSGTSVVQLLVSWDPLNCPYFFNYCYYFLMWQMGNFPYPVFQITGSFIFFLITYLCICSGCAGPSLPPGFSSGFSEQGLLWLRGAGFSLRRCLWSHGAGSGVRGCPWPQHADAVVAPRLPGPGSGVVAHRLGYSASLFWII